MTDPNDEHVSTPTIEERLSVLAKEYHALAAEMLQRMSDLEERLSTLDERGIGPLNPAMIHAPAMQQAYPEMRAYLEMPQRVSDIENVLAETHNQMRVILAGRGKEKPVTQTDLGP